MAKWEAGFLAYKQKADDSRENPYIEFWNKSSTGLIGEARDASGTMAWDLRGQREKGVGSLGSFRGPCWLTRPGGVGVGEEVRARATSNYRPNTR